ncbi:MAG: hypothetical protein AB7N71_06875 [Phycisphaerae bacterium]
MIAFEDQLKAGGAHAIRLAAEFLMDKGPVHESLNDISRRLDELNVDYAVVDGMALVAHGYRRTTDDVDILVTQTDLETIHAALSGRGYLPPFEGSKQLRDTQTGVGIEFLISGQYPGDGKPKSVKFPHPAETSVVIDGKRYISLVKLVELKLASGMTNPGRLRDLADVQELIRTLDLIDALADQLDVSVRDEFRRLSRAVRENPQ